MSTEDKKFARWITAGGGNKFFARKVARNEEIFPLTPTPPPIYIRRCMATTKTNFARIYAQYEANDAFAKTWRQCA